MEPLALQLHHHATVLSAMATGGSAELPVDDGQYVAVGLRLLPLVRSVGNLAAISVDEGDAAYTSALLGVATMQGSPAVVSR
eukprot:COSAG03_NODE_20400_length_320_cov_0.538462_1_plen_82_part_01